GAGSQIHDHPIRKPDIQGYGRALRTRSDALIASSRTLRKGREENPRGLSHAVMIPFGNTASENDPGNAGTLPSSSQVSVQDTSEEGRCTGKVRRADIPFPGRLLRMRSPPLRWAMCLAMDRPSP